MKTFVRLMMLLLAAAGLRAQGTVEFKNLVPGGEKVQVLYPDNTRVDCPVEGFVVALFWAPPGTTDSSAFQQLGSAAPMVRPGYFSAGPRTIPEPFVGGANASFIVKAWQSQYASPEEQYEACMGKGLYCWWYNFPGVSAIWVMKTGNPNASPPDTPPAIGSFGFPGVVTSAPEPSILSLGLLGLAGWFLVQRMRA